MYVAHSNENWRGFVRRIEVDLFRAEGIDRVDQLFVMTGPATEYEIEIVGGGHHVQALTSRYCPASAGLDFELRGWPMLWATS
jgi:hypothetical protein